MTESDAEPFCVVDQKEGKYDFNHPHRVRQYVYVEIEELDFEGNWTYPEGTLPDITEKPWDKALEMLIRFSGTTIKSNRSSERARELLSEHRSEIRKAWVAYRIREINLEITSLQIAKEELEEELD